MIEEGICGFGSEGVIDWFLDLPNLLNPTCSVVATRFSATEAMTRERESNYGVFGGRNIGSEVLECIIR